MQDVELRIVDGPDKPDLQWAVAYPDRHLHIHFDTQTDAVAAHLDRMDELGDGTQFRLYGHLVSGEYKGWRFVGVYDFGARSGVIRAEAPR
ncbi:MAG TPA: hypothetical protein VG900_05575 [Hyphomicrobiaceae bacterium]|jgi:hypothetical protein|nr:hypothetical protein [Hyphomicrobiaceae bacterium]